MTKLSNPKALKESTFTEPSTELTTQIVNITPALANMLIEQTDQSVQRKSKRPQIDYLSKQILADKWQLNGDAIRQDIKGNIIDGLHRLKACVMADKAIKTLFIKGLPTEVIKTIDQAGAKRTLADYISIQYAESKYHNAIASSIQALYMFEINRYATAIEGGGTGRNKGSKIDTVYIDNFLAKNPNYFKFVADSIAIRSVGDLLLTPKTFIAFHWQLSQLSRNKADEFMYRFSTGEGLRKDNPIHALRARMIKSKLDSKSSLTALRVVCIFYQCWNLFVTGGKAPTRLSYKRVPALLNPSDFK